MNPIVRLALEEDIGTGDVTSAATVPEARLASGRFLAREPLIVAGLGLLPEIYGVPLSPSSSATATAAPKTKSSRRSRGRPACSSNASGWRSTSCSA